MKTPDDTPQPDLEKSTPASLETTVPAEIWIMVGSAFIIAIGFGIVAPLLPQFIVSFDVTMAAVGVVVSVFAASRLIFAPLSGAAVTKLGSRRTYMTGLLVVAVTTSAIGLAQEYWHIVALRALAGIGSTMFTVSAMGLIVKLSPPAIRGKCSAIYATAFLLGNVAGPVLGAALSFLGFRWPFMIYGIIVALSAAYVGWRMPHISSEEEHRGELPPMTLAEALGDSAYRASLVSSFAHGWINMGIRMSILPLFAAAVFHQGAAMAGYALAAFAAGNALVLQISGRLSDRFGRRVMIIIGLFLTGVFSVLLGASDVPLTMMVVSVLAGGSSALFVPSQQAAIADMIGNNRSGGQVLSTFQMALDFGAIISPILVGFLADRYGFNVAFATSGIIALIGVMAWFFAREPMATNKAVIHRPFHREE